MQVIRIPGYIADEKLHIARQYLEPQTQKDAGIPAAAASISEDAMHTLIDEYARRVTGHISLPCRSVRYGPSFGEAGLVMCSPVYRGCASAMECCALLLHVL